MKNINIDYLWKMRQTSAKLKPEELSVERNWWFRLGDSCSADSVQDNADGSICSSGDQT